MCTSLFLWFICFFVHVHLFGLWVLEIYMSGSAEKCVQALKLVFSNKITQIPIAMFLFFTQILET